MDDNNENTLNNQPEQPEPTTPPEPEASNLTTPEEEPVVPDEPVLTAVPEEPVVPDEPVLTAVPEEEPTPEPITTEEPVSAGPVNFNTISSSEEPAPIAPESSVAEPEKPKKKSGNALVLLAIFLALCGIGFGVYGMFFQEPKTITKTIEVPGECEGSEAVASSSEYIYIGEWGIKIKKPSTLKNINYSFNDSALHMTGLPADSNPETTPDFANIEKYSAGIISRMSAKTECDEISCGEIVYQDENYKYAYSHPQDITSADEANRELETKTVNLFKEMLTNKENYSKF